MDESPRSSSPLDSYLIPLAIAAIIGIVFQFQDWKLWLITAVGVFTVWLYIIGRNAPGGPQKPLSRSGKHTRKLTSNELALDGSSAGAHMVFRTACPVCGSGNKMPWGKLTDGVALNCRNCGTPLLISRQGDTLTVETNVLKRPRPQVQRCEICGRPVQNLGQGGGEILGDFSGVIFDSSGMIAGTEGPGDECQRCGRIYCTKCAVLDAECVCGSRTFRVVRLHYLDQG